MKLGELKPAVKKQQRTRVGRGIGSGLGKTAGRGHKGQKARSGGGVRRGFEGGQTPLYRRLPKRGFTNIHAKNYTEVTLTMLNKSKATDVSAETLLEEGQHFHQSELIIWARQLLSALHYLHTQTPPIIHSDIKPANLMLTPQGNICLIDFNISFFLDGKTLLGYTHGYSSPEQKRVAMSREHKGIEAIDVKTDIYSVGATFYHLATGSKMGENLDRALLEQCTSEAFAKVIVKATSKNKNARYVSSLKMFEALGDVLRQNQGYRRLCRQHHWLQTVFVMTMAFSILLVGYG